MIDIPIDKALVAVEVEDVLISDYTCKGCCFEKHWCPLVCIPRHRKDGKNVIFKLVDYPAKERGSNMSTEEEIIKSLSEVINKYNLECMYGGNVPDFVLGKVALNAIKSFAENFEKSCEWYHLHLEPGRCHPIEFFPPKTGEQE